MPEYRQLKGMITWLAAFSFPSFVAELVQAYIELYVDVLKIVWICNFWRKSVKLFILVGRIKDDGEGSVWHLLTKVYKKAIE